MCIIACKPAGVIMPTPAQLKTMWEGNPDGAGIMYTSGGQVVIDKGYMKFKTLQKRIERLENEIDTLNEAIVFHFRIKTHGTTSAENCHPFPITDSIGGLKKLKMRTDVGIAHNGIINITPRKDISDTMEYIASQLAPLKRAMPKFYRDVNLMTMISNAIESKMVFLNGKKELFYIGAFNEYNGIKYSNYSYEPALTYRTYSAKYASDYERIIPLMWLDDGDAYLTDSNGVMHEAYDYLIDEKNNVYCYSWQDDYAYPVSGMTIHDHTLSHAGAMFDSDKCEYVEVIDSLFMR